ncbi:putative nuclease HARBI1 [Schistocerca nitens]|uniref:putative nuclease HARBI1 n=1 Tax=Schistocerca nitens TaxID=7011 RepID=UPI00211918F8|nr:putative nuclease HARBI1 [Schistocerca nitens]
MRLPATAEEWLKIAKEYEEKWNFPRCLGAIDGRHIDIVAPPNSGTVYFNYKERFSIVLLAIADANYRIIYADVGTLGRISDGGVLKDTTFYKMLETKTLNIPPSTPLPGRSKPVPYVFVADEAFGLEENIVKPFPGLHEKNSWQRIFNYRACRARIVIENVFGIISAIYRVLRKQMLLSPEKATVVALACVYLHNFLQNRKSQSYRPAGTYDGEGDDGNVIPGSWRDTPTVLEPLPRTGRRTSLLNDNRREYAEYFCSIQGSIPWQYGK